MTLDLAAIKQRHRAAVGTPRTFGSVGVYRLVMTDMPALLAEVERLRRLHAPIDSYACQRCGRVDGLDAVVSSELWATLSEGRILGPAGEVGDGTWSLLCLWCMDELAAEKGITADVALHFAGRALVGGTPLVR